VDTIRVLAMDAVEKSGNGHPGTAMSLAPLAYLIFQRHLRHDPTDPDWVGRDRFVLSCGHSALTLYIQLYFSGYGMTLDDLKSFRSYGSRTPGHPEHGHTVGVEVSTGPLGQGVANATGMAMAARYERGLLDPDTPAGESPFDHTIFCIASDGDLQEGISSEASSLAAHQRLGNLIMIYDDNNISIEGDTSVAWSEDQVARYEAYGWHTQRVTDVNDVEALDAALTAARKETERPSFIALKSIIAWPAPNAQNTGAAHGAALGAEEVALTKDILGFDPDKAFEVDDKVLEHVREVAVRGRALHADWEKSYQRWRDDSTEQAALLDRMRKRQLPQGWADELPTFPAGKDVATRKASESVIQAIAKTVPEFWGGSADLSGSNNTSIKGAASFLPLGQEDGNGAESSPYGRVLHWGIREHAMGSTMNGISLHGGTRVYGGTFLVFSDYMRPAVRLASLMGLPVTYVWTHDSIGLGEDGPTHQPVEHLAALRAIPGLDVVRPADANETVIAWRTILEHTDRPAGLCLSRQNLPVYDRDVFASAEGVAHGGYVLVDAAEGLPDVVLIGTGSEVQIAVAAREALEAEGISARVVSMPCKEWFQAEEQGYRDAVIPPAVRARVSVEAAVAQGWREIVGDDGRIVSLEHYGASGSLHALYAEFGLTAEAVVAAAKASIAAVTR